MLTNEDAIEFANHHIEVWNTHKIDKIMQLYTDDVELFSPLAKKITSGASIEGKENTKEYFLAGLNKYPDLNFKLVNTLLCVDSITLYMKGVNDSLLAEVLFIDDNKKIRKVYAHYAC